MKVTIVSEGYESACSICGVFASRELAQAYIDGEWEAARDEYRRLRNSGGTDARDIEWLHRVYTEERFRSEFDMEEFDVWDVPDAWLKA